MIEHSEALSLEQKCLRPGHWVIEGYHVVRYGYRQWHKDCVTWLIYDVGVRPTVRTDAIMATKTLAAARDWIRENKH